MKLPDALSVLLFLFATLLPAPVFSAPAFSPEITVSGQVVEVTILISSLAGIEPERPLSRLRLLLQSSSAQIPSHHLDKTPMGPVITLFSNDMLSSALLDQSVQVTLTITGDEWGTRLWLMNLQAAPTQ